jgi:CheY-like chemotaxis protein
VAEMIAEMVSELGYGLAGRAHDTQSAHQALRSDRYDVVLLDMLFQDKKATNLPICCSGTKHHMHLSPTIARLSHLTTKFRC